MLEQNRIGEEGVSTMLSVASRAMNIEADIELIKQYDEYSEKRNPLFYAILVVLIGVLVGCVLLYKNGNWIWGSLLTIVSLFLMLFARSFGNPLHTKRIAYESGLLVPATVTSTTPLELVAMADMRSDDDIEPVWGLIKLQVKHIPHHTMSVGEKIPCVALFGMSVKGYRRHFEPRPVAWGYADKTLIAEAHNQINDTIRLADNRFVQEWEMLSLLADKMKDQPCNEVLFVDNSLAVKDL